MIHECSYEMGSKGQTSAEIKKDKQEIMNEMDRSNSKIVEVDFTSKFNQTGNLNSCVRQNNDW